MRSLDGLRLLRFRLRTLFVSILVLSLPLGWLAHGIHLAQRQKAAVTTLRELGAVAYYDYELDENGSLVGTFPATKGPLLASSLVFLPAQATPGRAANMRPGTWPRRLLGDDFFDRVQRIDLTYCNFHGSELDRLAAFPELRVLNLAWSNVTDDDLAALRNLPHLASLSLAGTEITDAGVQYLASLNGLRRLALGSTETTDASLRSLENLPQLEFVSLDGTQVTEPGIARLRDKLPHCHIVMERNASRESAAP